MSETPLYVLHPVEARALIVARQVLEAVEKRCSAQAWDATDRRRAFDLGKVSEAADIAESACFNVLNTASSYAGCQVSANAIDRAAGRVPRYPDAVIEAVPDLEPEAVGGADASPEVPA